MINEHFYLLATAEIERLHRTDTLQVMENGIEHPSELLYSKRMLDMLELFCPGSPNYLKIAAQCQHLKRWGVPRDNYPYDRRGYHEWRREVMEYQLGETYRILSVVGIEDSDIQQIIDVLRNQGDKTNEDAQIIMDTACLTFLKWYMEPFASKHESSKVIDILKKTMRKMSSEAISLVHTLQLNQSVHVLLDQVAH